MAGNPRDLRYANAAIVRTLDSRRAAWTTKLSRIWSVNSSGWKQLEVLIMADRMAIGWALGGKPSKWCFMASFNSSLSVSRSEKRRSSALVGSLPMMSR